MHLLDDRDRHVNFFDVVNRHRNWHLLHVMDRNRNWDSHLLDVVHGHLLHVMMMDRVHVIRHVNANVVVRTETERSIFIRQSDNAVFAHGTCLSSARVDVDIKR